MGLGILLIFAAGISSVLANPEAGEKCYRCTSSDDYHDKPANMKNLGLQCANNPEQTEPFEVPSASPLTVVCTTRFIQAPNNASDVIVERSYTTMENPESLADIGQCHNDTAQAHVLAECNCIGNLCNDHKWSHVSARTNLKEESLANGSQTMDKSESRGSLPSEHHQSHHNHSSHESHNDIGSRTGKSNNFDNNSNTMKSSAQKPKAKSTGAIWRLNQALYIFIEILLAFIVIA